MGLCPVTTIKLAPFRPVSYTSTTSTRPTFDVFDHFLVSLISGQLIPRLKAEVYRELYGAFHGSHPIPLTVRQSNVEVA